MRKGLSRPAVAFAFALAAFAVTGLATVAGATQFENRDSNCASCHTEPESAYVARAHGAVRSVDLASAHALIGQGDAAAAAKWRAKQM